MLEKEAIAFEQQREGDYDWRKVILHKQGKFYRAYEISAYLIKHYLCTEEFQKQRGDSKILQVKHYAKKNYDYVQLGFPLESLSKFIPSYASKQVLENDDLLIVIDGAQIPLEDTPEKIQGDYETWRLALPAESTINNQSKRDIKSGPSQQSALARSGLFSIVSEVIAYPLEDRTPEENIAFISSLKQQVAGLL